MIKFFRLKSDVKGSVLNPCWWACACPFLDMQCITLPKFRLITWESTCLPTSSSPAELLPCLPATKQGIVLLDRGVWGNIQLAPLVMPPFFSPQDTSLLFIVNAATQHTAVGLSASLNDTTLMRQEPLAVVRDTYGTAWNSALYSSDGSLWLAVGDVIQAQ